MRNSSKLKKLSSITGPYMVVTTSYDYENVESAGANDLMNNLVKLQYDLGELNVLIRKIRPEISFIVKADEFKYKDPVNGSLSSKLGIRFIFNDGSCLIYRLSGTGSVGATICAYIEQYEKDPSRTGMDSPEALAPLVDVAIKMSKIEHFTGRTAPTVIT